MVYSCTWQCLVNLWCSEAIHMTTCPTWESVYEFLERLLYVNFFWWEHYISSCSIPTGITEITLFKNNRFMWRSILLFFLSKSYFCNGEGSFCLVVHAGRWYRSCQFPGDKSSNLSVLANHGDKTVSSRRMSCLLFASAQPWHIMLILFVSMLTEWTKWLNDR